MIVTLTALGCGKEAAAPKDSSPDKKVAKAAPKTSRPADTPKPPANVPTANVPPAKPITFKPLSLGALGGGNDSPANPSSNPSASKSPTGKQAMDSVLAAMQPLQVFLGQWNTTTRNMGAGSAKWVWDFKTDKSQPTLVMSPKDHPYFDAVRITFLTGTQKFQLTAKDKEHQERIYQGEFTEKPHFISGDSGKPEPRFEMLLDEVGNPEARKLARVKLSQRDRNRAWMEVYQRVGKKFRLQDNVTSQRDGTSFAVSDTNYGDKECIVSQGLGTITINYMGRTYYVCCSGCQAAFNDDPTFWIDKAEERKKTEKK